MSTRVGWYSRTAWLRAFRPDGLGHIIIAGGTEPPEDIAFTEICCDECNRDAGADAEDKSEGRIYFDGSNSLCLPCGIKAEAKEFDQVRQTLLARGWKRDAVEALKAEYSRDLRGPARATLKMVLVGLSKRQDPKAKRDVAILRLLHDLGLRRGEVVGLDIQHLNLGAGTVSVLGKGRSARIALTLPPETKAALADWIVARGQSPGPLFTNFDRAGKGSRLTGTSLYRLTKGLGIGRPHGVRHLSLTTALDLTGGDIRRVQRFSRHRDVRVLGVYDDNRQDLAGEVARIVAANL